MSPVELQGLQGARPQQIVVGEGAYSADGALVRFVSVDRVESAVRQVDNTALWDAIDQMTAAISAEEWAKIPCDGAENPDRYI